MKRQLHFAFGALSLLLGGAAFGQTYQPLSVTGFNQDVIANGVGIASGSTTTSVDGSVSAGANFAFHSLDYKLTADAAAVTYGLPVDGQLTSPNLTGLTYSLMPYSGNNSLRLPDQNSSGTLTLATPITATALYLAASSGDGGSVISAQINFADGTSQTVADLTVTNWDSTPPTSTPAIISNIGRVKRTTGITGTGNFRLFQITVPVALANQSKLINSVTITKTSTGTESNIANIFAVSAKLPAQCPTMASASSAITSFTSATVNWELGTLGTGGTSATYTLEVYTDAAYTTAITGSPFTGITATSQALSGLTAQTTYYYRVKASNGSCESDYATGSFYTGYCVPTGSTSYYLTNVVTTGGTTNISNATGSSTGGYTNYSATQSVSQIPGGSFNITMNINTSTHYFYVWVDWNNDLDFSDAGETLVATTSYAGSYNGTINIPAGQAPGNYRMRVGNSWSGVVSNACGPSANGEFEDYTINVLPAPSCYFPTGLGATFSLTSSTISWTAPTSGTTPAGYEYVFSTTQGTPTGNGTAITGTTFTVPTTIGTTYYLYVRTNCGEGDYSSWSSATIIPNYCVPTGSTTYYLTNVVTTGGFANISNATGAGTAGYTNYSATQSVSQIPGGSFNISMNINTSTHYFYVWVDWNNDLDFSDPGEAIVATTSYAATYNGTINIPAGQALGNYRMRVGNSYSGTVSNACGPSTNGEFEDYTIAVVEQPADCVVPTVATIATSGLTTSNITVTVTAPDTAPTGYMLVRSAAATLTATPVTGTSYPVGTAFGGGTVVAWGTTVPVVNDYVSANTQFNYFVYTYNSGSTCFGPIYSTVVSASGTTCAVATINSGASNIGNFSANLNSTSVVGNGGAAATYTFEVSTSAEFATLFGTFTSTTNSYSLTGLDLATTYYYRVKAETTGCDNDAWSEVLSFATQSAYSPLDVTGYNADVIANGTGIANVSTTNDVDGVSNSYIAANYRNTPTSTNTVGLPVDRRLTNSGVTGLTFLLEDYSDNNSLRLPAQNQAGTLTLAQPVKLSNLYLALTSGSGASTISAQVNFQDGTSQTATGIAVIDWYGGATTASPALISGIGRANRTNATGAVETGASKVFYVTIPIDAANQSKLVASVTVTKTSTGATTPVPNIFAVSGKVIDECPRLNTAFTTATTNGATVTFGLQAESAAATSYSYEVYTDATFTTEVEGSPFTTTTTALTITTLNPLTTYYYRAQAINSACSSSYVTGSFTTLCQTPAAPVTEGQTFCGGATVADLEATAATGNTLKWYATNTATTPLAATTALASGVYFVSQTAGTCESPRASVTVTVTTVPAPTADAQTFCGTATVADLEATAATGATLTWAATSGGDALAATDALATGTYYLTQTVGDCTSTAITVTVTVNTVPAAPVADAQSFCTGATVAELEATAAEGATLTWSATEGGDALTATTVLATGTYYATQSLNGCTSAVTAVVVTVNTVAAPGAESQILVCTGATVGEIAVITAEGATVTWYATQGGEAIETTTELATGTYYVTQTVGECTSTATAVTVTVNAVPAAPTAEAQTFCEGATAADIVVTAAEGATLTWYLSEVGEPIAATTEIATGTYYVTQSLNGCTSAAVAVSVTVTAIPDAPEAVASQTFEPGETVAALEATFAEGTTATWYVLDGDVYVEIDATTLLIDGTTYYVSQSNGNCESDRTAITANLTSGTDTVAIRSLVVYPNPSTDVINIEAGESITHLTLINLLGQTVMQQNANGTQAKLNTGNIAAGTYILQVTAGSKVTAVKVIKQ